MQMEENVLTFKKLDHTGSGEFYVDIAQCMAAVNRRLGNNRQQGLWQVLGMNVWVEEGSLGGVPVLNSTGVPYTVAVSGAARNWVTRNALVKMFKLWIEQQRHAQNALDVGIKPRWEDFKVYLNENHRAQVAAGAVLLPTSGHMFGGTDAVDGGDWVHSKIVFEQADAVGLIVEHEPELHIIGADNGNTNKGIITQYAQSRPMVQSPDPLVFSSVDDSIYAEAADPLADQMQEVVENMIADNNEPPYPNNAYVGGGTNANEPMLFAYGSNTNTLGRKITLNGFAAPNGLLELQLQAELNPLRADTADVWFQIIVGKRVDY